MNKPILIYHPISLYTCNSLPSALRTHSIYFTILLHYPITATNHPANHRLPPRTVYPDHHSILLPPHIDGSTSNHIFTIHDTLASVHAYIYIYLNKYTLIWTNICLHPSILCTIYTVINKGLRLIDILPSRNACPDHLPSPINHSTPLLPPTIMQIHLHLKLAPYIPLHMLPFCYACDRSSTCWLASCNHELHVPIICVSHSQTLCHYCLTIPSICLPYEAYALFDTTTQPTNVPSIYLQQPSIRPANSLHIFYHSVTLPNNRDQSPS